jgi:DNA-binding beta-propeller fold protein YncE
MDDDPSSFHKLAIWDAGTGRLTARRVLDDVKIGAGETGAGMIGYANMESLRVSADGERVLVTYRELDEYYDVGLALIDTATGKTIASWAPDVDLSYGALEADPGLTVFAISAFNRVTVTDAATDARYVLDHYGEHTEDSAASGPKLAFTPDGRTLILSDEKLGTVEVRDAKTGALLFDVPITGQIASTPLISHDGKRAAVYTTQKYLTVVGIETGEVVFSVYDEHLSAPEGFSLDDAYIYGETVRDAQTGALAYPVRPATKPGHAISDGDAVLAAIAGGRYICIPSVQAAYSALQGFVREYGFTPAGKRAFALG